MRMMKVGVEKKGVEVEKREVEVEVEVEIEIKREVEEKEKEKMKEMKRKERIRIKRKITKIEKKMIIERVIEGIRMIKGANILLKKLISSFKKVMKFSFESFNYK